MTSTLAKHTAAPQLAGYVYQLQQAMLRLFDLTEGESLGIELLDDLHVAADGVPSDLEQVKHHGDSQAVRLGDKSVELWKTVGIWASAVQDGSLDLSQIRRLALVTRADVVPDSVPALLTSGADPAQIVSRILELRDAAGAYAPSGLTCLCALPEEQHLALVGKVTILAGQPGLMGTVDVLAKRLRHAGFHDERLDEAVERLSGWLWVRIVEGLGAGRGVLIGEDQFHIALCHVRDDLTKDDLPLRYAEAVPDSAELAGQADAVYVRQLRLVEAGDPAVRRSIVHFFRATRERVEWLRRGDVLPDELRHFDSGLIERWEPMFETMCLDISDVSDAAALRKLGLKHFLDVERLDFPLLGRTLDHYVTCGSYHALADDVSVGWHPHFRVLLAAGPPSPNGHQ
jgi:hypothetical protein